MDFKEKRVIITGGTKGLGKAMASAFANEGAWVAVNYSSDEESAGIAEGELKTVSKKILLKKIPDKTTLWNFTLYSFFKKN